MLPAAQPASTATQWITMPAYASYAHQLRLIDSLRQFCTDELKLNIGDSFYTTWKESSDSMFVYLYVSRADTIALPDMVSTMIWAFEREDSAITKSNELRMQGYHTLVYKTAGTSGAFLNHKLLSYPDEAIAFIVFHEAVHRHVGQMIDYNYIEALCDAVATRAAVQFAAKTGRLAMPEVVKQKNTLEEAYRFLNAKRVELDKLRATKNKKVFDGCQTKIKRLLKEANPFLRDRMIYPVNNAYFIRVQPYAIHYFEMYDGLGESIDITNATTGLPGAEQLKPQNEIKLLPDKGNPVYDWGR
jgi:predicted aminopeptidase